MNSYQRMSGIALLNQLKSERRREREEGGEEGTDKESRKRERNIFHGL